MRLRLMLATALAAVLMLSGCAQSAQPPNVPVSPIPATHTPTPASPADNGSAGGASTPEPTVDNVLPLTPTAVPGTGDVITRLAVVDRIDLSVAGTNPPVINAVIGGSMPDGCTKIGKIDQSFDPNTKTFTITLSTTRPKDAMCAEMLVSYKQHVQLALSATPAGMYTVVANGKTATINIPPATPQP